MTMLFKTFRNAALITLSALTTAIAQEKPKASAPKKPLVILLPDFYKYEKVVVGDTTYSYEIRDGNGNTIPVDDIRDQSQIHVIVYYQSFFKFPPKPGSPISPPYVSMRQYAYERESNNVWIGANTLTKEREEFKADMKKIVKSETHPSTAPANRGEPVMIKYYKTTKTGADKSLQQGAHTHSH